MNIDDALEAAPLCGTVYTRQSSAQTGANMSIADCDLCGVVEDQTGALL